MADLDAGAAHPFSEPTGHELVFEGQAVRPEEGSRYAPKAVIGLACRHLLGKLLQPGDVSEGEAPGQANEVLRQLGFTVAREGQGVEDWSEHEVSLAVADYYDVLRKGLLGQQLNKSEHRRALLPQSARRLEASIRCRRRRRAAPR
jgi:hypothetical protein